MKDVLIPNISADYMLLSVVFCVCHLLLENPSSVRTEVLFMSLIFLKTILKVLMTATVENTPRGLYFFVPHDIDHQTNDPIHSELRHGQ